MMRLMNEWETAQGILCDACSDFATHCDLEAIDFLFLCHFHFLEYAMIYAGAVSTTETDNTIA